MQRIFIIVGIALLILGLTWPWLKKLGLFRLPGDIVIERDGFSFYFPITTAIIISIMISLVIYLVRRFM
jgi:hypothetical protein